MPFGISPAPEIFQRWLEQQLIGLDGVSNIHDDILVIGEGNDLEEAVRNHDQRMDKLLQRCAERNIALNTGEKFCLRCSELPYMGHIFTSQGVKADPAKITAIENFPTPTDVASLRRFLEWPITFLNLCQTCPALPSLYVNW